MAIVLFSNNATSTLAGSITNVATSVSIAPGTGVEFPNPGANQYFVATMVDAATGQLNEVVHVTAVSADTMTIVRGQEGTAARAWNAGDTFASFWTAGCAQAMLQQGQAQQQTTNYAVDSGAVNTMLAALSPAPSAQSALVGTPIRVKVAHTNTSTAVSLNVNSLGAFTVVLPDGTAPPVGSIPIGGIAVFIWDGTNYQYIGIISPASVGQVQAGTDNAHPITSLALAGAMAGTHSGGSGNGTGYQKFPNGSILQWGKFFANTGNDTIVLPVAFPTGYTIATDAGTTSGPNIANADTGVLNQFNCITQRWNGSAWVLAPGLGVGWIAFGY